MPGIIVDIKVKVGDTIKKGDLVAIIEQWKWQIISDKRWVLSAINVSKGQQVDMGAAIITL